jgi:hypothetical protein
MDQLFVEDEELRPSSTTPTLERSAGEDSKPLISAQQQGSVVQRVFGTVGRAVTPTSSEVLNPMVSSEAPHSDADEEHPPQHYAKKGPQKAPKKPSLSQPQPQTQSTPEPEHHQQQRFEATSPVPLATHLPSSSAVAKHILKHEVD